MTLPEDSTSRSSNSRRRNRLDPRVAIRPDPVEGRSLCQLSWQLDLAQGRLQACPTGDEWGEWIGRALGNALDRKLLTKLRRRRAETLEWSEPESWLRFDVGRFQPGIMVCYYTVFPRLQPDFMLEGNQPIFAVDHYCCTHGCACTQVHLVLADNQRERGQLTYDYRSGQTQVVKGTASLLDLWRQLLVVHPHLPQLLARRGAFMTGPFAEHLHQARSPALRVGRNQLCYCGSGKKFKKCCLTA